MNRLYVEIREYDDRAETDPVVKRFGPFSSEREAERIDSGANVNLNHDRFYTMIVSSDAPVRENSE